MENEIIAKEKGFIYKGEYYLISDLTIDINYLLVNIENEEEKYMIYSCSMKDIPMEKTYKIKRSYSVKKGFSTLETFDTEEEAKHFIELATINIK